MVRIKDAKLLESLQLDPELTLARATTKVRQSIALKKQQFVLRGTEPTAGQVEAIYKKHYMRKQTASQQDVANVVMSRDTCVKTTRPGMRKAGSAIKRDISLKNADQPRVCMTSHRGTGVVKKK